MKVIVLNPTAGGNLLTDGQCEELISGRARLKLLYVQGWEQPRSMKLSPDQQNEFEEIKKRGWCVRRKNDKPSLLAYYWLEAHKKPLVKIELKRKYARVVLDLISVERAVSGLWESMSPLNPPIPIGGECQGWGIYTYFDRVPKDRAIACAEWLVSTYRGICVQ